MPNDYEAIYNIRYLFEDQNTLYLRWEINQDIVRPGDVFEIRRSNSPDDELEYDTLSKHVDINYFRDETANLFSKWRTFYYSIVVKRLSAATKEYVPIFTAKITIGRDNRSALTQRLVDFRKTIHKKVLQNKGYVLVRKTTGERCSSCYDEHYKSVTKSDCKECYGTTFKKGYYDPIVFYYAHADVRKVSIEADPSRMENANQRFEIPGGPIVAPGDLILDVNQTRWEVQNVTSSEFKNATGTQIAICKALDFSDVQYNYPAFNISNV